MLPQALAAAPDLPTGQTTPRTSRGRPCRHGLALKPYFSGRRRGCAPAAPIQNIGWGGGQVGLSIVTALTSRTPNRVQSRESANEVETTFGPHFRGKGVPHRMFGVFRSMRYNLGNSSMTDHFWRSSFGPHPARAAGQKEALEALYLILPGVLTAARAG